MPKETNQFYEFGPYRLDVNRRRLTRDGEPLPLTSKGFDTLLALVTHRERVLTKDELMKLLWPDSFVEEANLAQNVSGIRKLLGESPDEKRFIATIPGKGYRFVAEVRDISAPSRDSLITPENPDDVIVERRTRSSVTIRQDEEIEDSGPSAQQIQSAATLLALSATTGRRSRLVQTRAMAVLILAAGLAFAGW